MGAETPKRIGFADWIGIGAVLLLVCVYGALIAYNSLQLDGRFTPDSVIYINAAENVLRGEGYARSIVELYLLIDLDERIPLAVTQWAPLYPLAIAASGLLTDARFGALFLSAACVAPVLLLGGWLVGQRGGWAGALLAVGLLANFVPLRYAGFHAWSETLALTWMLAAFVCLLALDGQRRTNARAFLAGVFAGLAFATRFALLPLPIVCLGWIVFRHRREALRPALIFLAPWALIAMPLMLRNVYHAGSIGGAPWGSGRGSYGAGLGELARALVGSITPSLWIAAATAGGTAGIVYAAARWRTRTDTDAHGPARTDDIMCRDTVGFAWALLAWAFVYFAFILVAQARVRVDAIDIRLALPGSLALVLAAVTFVCGSVRVPRVLGAMVASALLIGAIAPQASTARAIAKVGAIPPHDALRVLHRSPVLAWLEANATANDLIIAEDGLDFPFYLGPLHIAFFSEAQHPDQFLEYADTREYLVRSNSFERYERVWLVLQNRNGVETGMHPDDVFRADLVSGRLSAYPDVTLVETLEDALIFEWRAAPI